MTLRETIASQKSLINEYQISAEVHNQLAMMFLDEMVDDGESLTPQEQLEKIAQIKEIHKINNELSDR